MILITNKLILIDTLFLCSESISPSKILEGKKWHYKDSVLILNCEEFKFSHASFFLPPCIPGK